MFFFKPTDKKDHLATAYREVVRANEAGEKWLRLSLSCFDTRNRVANWILLVQDEKFNSLFSCCYDPSEEDCSEGYIRYLIKIPANVESVRLSLCSKNGASTQIPSSMVLEQIWFAGNEEIR